MYLRNKGTDNILVPVEILKVKVWSKKYGEITRIQNNYGSGDFIQFFTCLKIAYFFCRGENPSLLSTNWILILLLYVLQNISSFLALFVLQYHYLIIDWFKLIGNVQTVKICKKIWLICLITLSCHTVLSHLRLGPITALKYKLIYF